jgi:hypothetical protein
MAAIFFLFKLLYIHFKFVSKTIKYVLKVLFTIFSK